MIGHIQSRKANIVMDHFDYVHSMDSLKIAQRLQRRGEETGRSQIVLVEVNLGQEETKNGYRVGNSEEYDIFISDILEISKLSMLSIKGLMTMPPITNDGEESRKYFIGLRRLLEKVNNENLNLQLTELSMGTSQDFKIAIEEGATMLRIGTLVFGERQWHSNYWWNYQYFTSCFTNIHITRLFNVFLPYFLPSNKPVQGDRRQYCQPLLKVNPEVCTTHWSI